MVRSTRTSPPRAGAPAPPSCDTEPVGRMTQVRVPLHSGHLVPERRGASKPFCLEAAGPDHSVERRDPSCYLEPSFLPPYPHSRTTPQRLSTCLQFIAFSPPGLRLCSPRATDAPPPPNAQATGHLWAPRAISPGPSSRLSLAGKSALASWRQPE